MGKTLALAMIMGAAACAPSPDGSGTEPVPDRSVLVMDPSREVLHAAYSGLGTATRLRISAGSAWVAMWERIHSTMSPVPEVPAIDFDREHVLVEAIGSRSSGGFGVHIDSVVTTGNGAIAYVTRSEPGQGCMLTMALTQPVHVVRIPREAGTITYRERTVSQPCR